MKENIIIILLLAIGGYLYYTGRSKNVKAGHSREHTLIIDSCALIDGRVVELVKIGFLTHQIIIPTFIIKELQMLADGRDPQKRERGRFGLEIVQQLQKFEDQVSLSRDNPNAPTVDEKLVALAKTLGADLFTSDFNLNQVASIEGVTVLNINELAHALRPVVLPGESIDVVVVQSGTNKDQGVGYLDDGTMVVIDGAIRDIGKKIHVAITKSHQSVAGKMLFAKKDSQPQSLSKNAGPSNRLRVPKDKNRAYLSNDIQGQPRNKPPVSR